MKLSELKQTLKEVVKEAIQEELKEVLYESFKNGRPQVQNNPLVPPVVQPQAPAAQPGAIRESYMNVLGDMKAQFTSGHVPPTQGVQVNGPVDTTSPNGRLPEGEVSMDQIMGIMNK